MLQPMRTKFRKAHKGRIHGFATSAVSLTFGQYDTNRDCARTCTATCNLSKHVAEENA